VTLLPKHSRKERAERLVAALGTALWLVACASAPEGAAPQPAPVAPAPRVAAPEPEQGGLVFWRVEGRYPEPATAWLLGSLHVGSSEFRYDPAITSAFADADALVVEVDPGAATPEESLQVLATRAVLPLGQTLADTVEPETLAELQSFAEAHGRSVDEFSAFEPWFVMIQLTGILFAEQGYLPEYGVDQHFLSLARGRRPVIELESEDLQLGLFAGLPFPLQDRMLRSLLEHPDAAAQSPALLVAAWQSGNLDALEGALLEGDPEVEALHDRIYDQRNRKMAARIDDLLRRGGRYFVVVGAGHMVGDGGLPVLLARRGHRVSRVEPSECP
jgi:uncharacterized protein YbaP (TraB family)